MQKKDFFLIIFIMAALRFVICNLDRCLVVPENHPPTTFQLVKLKRAGFVFAPKCVQEPLPSFPSQSHSLPVTKQGKFQATVRKFLKVTTL